MNGYYRLLIQTVSPLVMYLRLITNSLDSSTFGNNGVDTLMTYSGGYAKFGTGYVTIADADTLSFTDRTTDTSCHIAFGFIWNSKTGQQFFLNKRDNGANIEWQVVSDGTNVMFWIFDGGGAPLANYLQISIPVTSITASTLHTLQFAYDGSKSHTGLSAYLNNTPIGTSSMVGSYVKNRNGNAPLVIGKTAWANSLYWKADAKDIAIWKNRTMTPTEIATIDYNIKNNIPLS